ncbi:EthD family reductase [Rhizobium sp. KVB221]|uniref:EthD family reductase n=1 Tax=Rhizobium setariae TaxID=2801340 RepID=A0A936YT15_9HYPH|nr:EthD family reductase [Rhizobium setariae]MBL0371895.1 EthD family reductase [Rhizobium setariae]
MHKLIALYNHPADIIQFRQHLEQVHLPLVSKFQNLRAMRHAFDIAGGDNSPYYALVECEFDTRDAMQAALDSPEGAAAAADVPNYAAAGVTILTYEVAAQLRCERFSGDAR